MLGHAGQVPEALEHQPRVAEHVEVGTYRLVVTGVEGRRVARVRIERCDGPPVA